MAPGANPIPLYGNDGGDRDLQCPHYFGCREHADCRFHGWTCGGCEYRGLSELSSEYIDFQMGLDAGRPAPRSNGPIEEMSMQFFVDPGPSRRDETNSEGMLEYIEYQLGGNRRKIQSEPDWLTLEEMGPESYDCPLDDDSLVQEEVDWVHPQEIGVMFIDHEAGVQYHPLSHQI